MKNLLIGLMAGLFLPLSLGAQCSNQWVRQISGVPTGNFANGSPSMVIDHLGNVIVSNVIVGADTILTDGQEFPETNSFPPNDDFFIAKYNSTGSLVWLKTVLGVRSCGPFDMDTDGTGNIYVGGIMQNSINVDGTLIERPTQSLPQPGYFILKFNPEGQLQWYHKGDWKGSRCYRLTWTGSDLAFVIPYSDSVSVGGEVFYSDDISWHQDMVFGKLDTDGNLIEAVNIGGEGNVEVNSLACDLEGCILQGRFDRELSFDGTSVETPAENHFELYQMSIGPNYNLDWLNHSQSLPAIDPRAYGLGLSNDGYVYFSGFYSHSGFNLGDLQLPASVQDDIFMGQLSRSDGSITWLKKGTGSSFDGTKCLVTHGSHIWIAGDFYSDILGYEGSSFTNSIDDENDGFLLSLEADGKLKCGLQLEGFGQNGILQVDAFGDGHIAILAYFNGTVDFGGQTYSAQGNYDLLVIKTCLPCDTLTSINEAQRAIPILQLYPNPASQTLRFKIQGSEFQVQNVAITDMLGHKVLNSPPSKEGSREVSFEMDLSTLAPGLYTVSATLQSGETLRQRLVVQR